MSENLKLPSKIESFQNFASDDRFIKVKLSLCTYQQIANLMHFSKELLESKTYQIDYMPIYGLIKIKENDDGTCEYYMGDHETEYDIEDGELKLTSKTVILGVALPNTSKFEMITRHGETKEYVTFEALLYSKKYPQLKTVVTQDLDASMEISDVEKHWNDDTDCYEIDDMNIDAHCLIGVQPAFKLAGVLEKFSLESFKSEFEELLNEVKFSLNIINQQTEMKGGDSVENEETKVAEMESQQAETGNTSEEELSKEDAENEDDMTKKKRCEEDGKESKYTDEQYEVLLSKYEKLESDFNDITSKYNDVNGKYAEIISKQEYSKKVEVVDTFKEKLTDDEIKSVIDNVNKFSIQEIDDRLTLALGKKVKAQKEDVKLEEANTQQSNFSNLESFNSNSYFAQLAKKIKNNK